MPLHEAFAQHIAASPDDDTPRLAYADWLDDHGDPALGEFIRTQFALARLSSQDARRALAASAYLSGLRTLDLLYGTIGPAGTTELVASPRLAGLTALLFRVVTLGTAGVEALAARSELTRISKLSLRSGRLGDAGMAAL